MQRIYDWFRPNRPAPITPQPAPAATTPNRVPAARQHPPQPAGVEAPPLRDRRCVAVTAWLKASAGAMLRTLVAHGTAQLAVATSVRAAVWQQAKDSDEAMRYTLAVAAACSLIEAGYFALRGAHLWGDSRHPQASTGARALVATLPVAVQMAAIAVPLVLCDEDSAIESAASAALIEAVRMGNALVRDTVNQYTAKGCGQLVIRHAEGRPLDEQEVRQLDRARLPIAWLSYTAASLVRALLVNLAVAHALGKRDADDRSYGAFWREAAPAYFGSLALELYDELSQIGCQALAARQLGHRVDYQPGVGWCESIRQNARSGNVGGRIVDHSTGRAVMLSLLDLSTGVGKLYTDGSKGKLAADVLGALVNGTTGVRGFLVGQLRSRRDAEDLASRRLLLGGRLARDIHLHAQMRVKAQLEAQGRWGAVRGHELRAMVRAEEASLGQPGGTDVDADLHLPAYDVVYAAESNTLQLQVRDPELERQRVDMLSESSRELEWTEYAGDEEQQATQLQPVNLWPDRRDHKHVAVPRTVPGPDDYA